MRRPTRTPRLSIAAIASLLAFGVVLGIGVRSFWMWDQWHLGMGKIIAIENGCVSYAHISDKSDRFPMLKHDTFQAGGMPAINDSIPPIWSFAGFSQRQIATSRVEAFSFGAPLWPLLLLLLISPVRWLMARPIGPAFPVIADASKG